MSNPQDQNLFGELPKESEQGVAVTTTKTTKPSKTASKPVARARARKEIDVVTSGSVSGDDVNGTRQGAEPVAFYGTLNNKAVIFRYGNASVPSAQFGTGQFREVPIDLQTEDVCMLSGMQPAPVHERLVAAFAPVDNGQPEMQVFYAGPFKISREFHVFLVVAANAKRAAELYYEKIVAFGYEEVSELADARLRCIYTGDQESTAVVLMDIERLVRREESESVGQTKRKRHRAEAKSSVRYYEPESDDDNAGDDDFEAVYSPSGRFLLGSHDDDMSSQKRARF